jgi:hypothetical protein
MFRYYNPLSALYWASKEFRLSPVLSSHELHLIYEFELRRLGRVLTETEPFNAEYDFILIIWLKCTKLTLVGGQIRLSVHIFTLRNCWMDFG